MHAYTDCVGSRILSSWALYFGCKRALNFITSHVVRCTYTELLSFVGRKINCSPFYVATVAGLTTGVAGLKDRFARVWKSLYLVALWSWMENCIPFFSFSQSGEEDWILIILWHLIIFSPAAASSSFLLLFWDDYHDAEERFNFLFAIIITKYDETHLVPRWKTFSTFFLG